MDPADMDDFDDAISPEDILEIIELDDNGVMPDVMAGIDLQEREEGYVEDGDDMGYGMASGEDVKDMADLVFDKHTDAVFCVDLDPVTSDLAITGGQDDRAYVWKISTGEVLLECTGHKDSVTCTGFSHDGVYVASADLSGLVKVWKIETKEEVFSFDGSDAEWLKWHPASHVLFLGTVDGEVWMWKIPSGECKTIQSPGCTASCGVIMGDGKRACVGYDDGTVRVWDLKTATAQHTITGNLSHGSTVTCIDCHSDNNLIVTGSTDVTAKIISTSTGKVLTTFDCSNKGEGDENSIETVAFCPTQNYVAVGTVAGELNIFDMHTKLCRYTCKHDAGIVGLQWDRLSPFVYTSSLDGAVRLWDSRNGETVSTWTGHTDSILGFQISRDSNSLVTVSEDKTSRVFSLSAPER